MTKLPPKKRTKKIGGPVTTSTKLVTSKARPKKNVKNAIKKNILSGSSPKPTKTTDSKAQPTQMKKKESKKVKKKNLKKTVGGKRAKPTDPKQVMILKKRFKNEVVVDQKLMKKYAKKVNGTPKAREKDVEIDPTELINPEMLEAAVSGLRKLPSAGKGETKSLHDITDEDERHVYLQVTLCKLPKVNDEFHLAGPTTVSVYLPHSLATDNTDVILITKDMQRGIKRDHENSLNYYKELLHKHDASSLVNEVIPLRQLKVEYREFEAKRLLANRTDVLLCDDTVIRFIPKFLTKHFYTKKKLPVQVNLKAKDLQKELLRALAVSKLFFSMKGNSSIMKIGHMSQTDDEIQENILAAVKKLSTHVSGKWTNVQVLSLKLERTTSIPIYVKMDSLNTVKSIPARQLYPGEVVSGTLSTQPGKCITVFPDGSVTATKLNKNKERITKEEATNSQTEKPESKVAKKGKKGKKSAKSENNVALTEPETEASSTKEEIKKKNSTKRKATEKKSSKVKKQKKAHGSESDSDEDELEEQEMMYLKQLNQGKEEASKNHQEEEEEEKDVWADSDSDMEDSDNE